jgi:hypothetical protein
MKFKYGAGFTLATLIASGIVVALASRHRPSHNNLEKLVSPLQPHEPVDQALPHPEESRVSQRVIPEILEKSSDISLAPTSKRDNRPEYLQPPTQEDQQIYNFLLDEYNRELAGKYHHLTSGGARKQFIDDFVEGSKMTIAQGLKILKDDYNSHPGVDPKIYEILEQQTDKNSLLSTLLPENDQQKDLEGHARRIAVTTSYLDTPEESWKDFQRRVFIQTVIKKYDSNIKNIPLAKTMTSMVKLHSLPKNQPYSPQNRVELVGLAYNYDLAGNSDRKLIAETIIRSLNSLNKIDEKQNNLPERFSDCLRRANPLMYTISLVGSYKNK